MSSVLKGYSGWRGSELYVLIYTPNSNEVIDSDYTESSQENLHLDHLLPL